MHATRKGRVRTENKDGSPQALKRALTRNWVSRRLTVAFWTSRTVGNPSLWFKPSSVIFCYSSPSWLRQSLYSVFIYQNPSKVRLYHHNRQDSGHAFSNFWDGGEHGTLLHLDLVVFRPFSGVAVIHSVLRSSLQTCCQNVLPFSPGNLLTASQTPQRHDIVCNVTYLHITTPETSHRICIFELDTHMQLNFLMW